VSLNSDSAPADARTPRTARHKKPESKTILVLFNI
jgi:hypothetical protein